MRRAQTTFLAVLLLVGGTFPLGAQTPPGGVPSLRTGVQVVPLDKENFKRIPADAKVIRLDVTLKDMGKDAKEIEENAKPLLEWVQQGGIIWLHTDAAQLFGFRTVSSPMDLLGKAKPVVPWAAHPLTQGVREVFYRLSPVGVLVTGHPLGMMLMRVADSPTPRPQPLFVVATVEYGDGIALFAPPDFSQRRAEGLQFYNNLQRFLAGEPATDRVPGRELAKVFEQWQKVASKRNLSEVKEPLSAITAYTHLWMGRLLHRKLNKPKDALAELEKAATANNQIADVYAALSDLYTALDEKDKAALAKKRAEELAKSERAPVPDARMGAGLLLTEGELKQLVQLSDAVSGGSEDKRKELGAMLTTLIGRVWYQASFNPTHRTFDLTNAEKLFVEALRQHPTSRHALFWFGALRVTQGLEPRQPSPQRAARLQDAIRLWQEFLSARGDAQDEPKDNAFPSPDQLSAWGDGLKVEITRLSLEPPDFHHDPRSGLIVRYLRSPDTGWQEFAGNLQAAIANAANLGLRVEDPELLIFPTDAAYQQYRLLTKRSFPEFGPNAPIDVAGEVILSGPQPNQGFLTIARRNEYRKILSHFFGHVVVTAWTEGGPDIPGWLTEGIASGLSGDLNTRSILQQAVRQGLLLRWNDLQTAPLPPSDLFYAQSQEMVAFLARIGSQRGGVVRMLQLLGMGVRPEEALMEVTGMTPEQFMRAWAQATLR
ncbi:MAG: hypothetical protein NZT92_11150 [Abditibacteriales bacterium]|nr:hypothetical protein [Abditibacteriales bacterium]MDW8366458.1 hypothetical protein [Abditibacteriales bacterium]